MFLASTTPHAGKSPSQVSSRQLPVDPPKSLRHAADLGVQSNTVEQTVAVPIPQIPKETHQITIANKKGGSHLAGTDHVNQEEAEDSRDEDEVDKMKIEAKNGLKESLRFNAKHLQR